MSTQFIHYEKYTLSELQNIFAEAMRTDGYCPHVENPIEPTVLKGDLNKLQVRLETEVPTFKRTLNTTVKGKKVTCQRGLRSDANVLLAGVASFGRAGAKRGDPDYDRFEKLTMKRLEKEYGDQLQAVIAHFDEGYPHLHFYVVPRDYDMTNACRFDRAVKETGKKTDGIRALKAFQDDYYNEVGMYCGMSRTGPRRRRLTRQQWVDEKSANELAANCINKTLAIAAKQKKTASVQQKQVAGVVAALAVIKPSSDVARLKAENEALKLTVAEQATIIELTTGLGSTPPEKDTKPENQPQTQFRISEDL